MKAIRFDQYASPSISISKTDYVTQRYYKHFPVLSPFTSEPERDSLDNNTSPKFRQPDLNAQLNDKLSSKYSVLKHSFTGSKKLQRTEQFVHLTYHNFRFLLIRPHALLAVNSSVVNDAQSLIHTLHNRLAHPVLKRIRAIKTQFNSIIQVAVDDIESVALQLMNFFSLHPVVQPNMKHMLHTFKLKGIFGFVDQAVFNLYSDGEYTVLRKNSEICDLILNSIRAKTQKVYWSVI